MPRRQNKPSRARRADPAKVSAAWHALQIGKAHFALNRFRKLLEAHGETSELVRGLGLSLVRTGKPHEACSWLERLAKRTDSPEDWLNLGAARLAAADLEGARRAYERALSRRPGWPDAVRGMSGVIAAEGRLQEAAAFIQAQEASIGRLKALRLQLPLYEEYDDIESEIRCLESILELAPDATDEKIKLAITALQLGDRTSAIERLQSILEREPMKPEALARLAEAKSFRLSPEDPLRSRLRQAFEQAENDKERDVLAAALGNVFDRDGDTAEAFRWLNLCHDIRARYSTYKESQYLRRLEAIRRSFSTGSIHPPEMNDATLRPIFILGMPRCGSTLTEQILASHPSVTPLGEWGGFEVTLSAWRPEGKLVDIAQMANFDSDTWNHLGREYLKRVVYRSVKASFVTDKSLGNIWHIGAIRNALPHARIIHVRRHPLDTCLSIYKANIAGSLFDYAHRIEELGRYYRLYLDLMAHWRNVLPPGGWMEIDYETLVTEPESTIRRMLDYCGLAWDDNCLNFHRSRNVVRTASITQVRNPINNRSVGGWKRYEKELEPLIKELGPAFSTEYSPGMFSQPDEGHGPSMHAD